jgi:hypothetical protein
MVLVKDWNAKEGALWLERSGSRVLSLRHPAYPAEGAWNGSDGQALLAIAADYLAKVQKLFGLPELFDGRKFKVPLAWLNPSSDLDTLHPRDWVSLARYGNSLAANRVPLDRTITLVATETLGDGKDVVLGSRRGISITAHLHRGRSRNWQVRITSASCSLGLAEALDDRRSEPVAVANFHASLLEAQILLEVKTKIRRFAGFDDDVAIAIDGIRLGPTTDRGALELYATATPPEDRPDELAYAMRVQFVFTGNVPNLPLTIRELDRDALVTHAARPVRADIFALDPASKAGRGVSPNQSSAELAKQVDRKVLLNGLRRGANGTTKLDDRTDLVRVVSKSQQAITVSIAGGRKVRSEAFSALSSYGHGRGNFADRNIRSLFDTIIAYGLWPYGYFRFADYPLLVRDRASIRPGSGKDGKTVNAQVKLLPAECDLIGPPKDWQRNLLRWLEVRFALADVKRTTARRDRLGLSADARWSWHEYCHVLLAGQTSKLEFSFAHSAGDALAAITADPWSKLADIPYRPYARGYTFPWAYLHRRHDRSVSEGWSWSGSRHRPARFVHPNINTRHKGYDSEQILSTSLFRLYLALGGETVGLRGPDRPARQRAADYATYLILRAIRALPPHAFNVMETPDQLVTKLIDADVATWPTGSGPLRNRAGGWAHKVVRWAFEAQGLYATTDPAAVVNTPGKPPSIDVFIDDRRPDSEGRFARGGYMPVSLDFQGTPPRWHAHPQAVAIDNRNRVTVQVRNRGDQPAPGVTVEVWYIRWPNSAANPPPWDRRTWSQLRPSRRQRVPAWPHPGKSFGPFALPGQPRGTRLLVMAVAHCEADPANTEQSTGLPCAWGPVPVVDIVAGDNNLGLVVHPFS